MWFSRDVFIQCYSEKIERVYPFYFYTLYKEIWTRPSNIFVVWMKHQKLGFWYIQGLFVDNQPFEDVWEFVI